MSGKLGRLFLLVGFIILIGLFAWEVFADEPQIVEVRRNIPLADKDPVYRDYYINAGTEAGLKANLVVTALRKSNIKDARGTQSYGEILIPVGQLKIIFVQNRISVAREYKSLSRNEHPMLEQTGILSGDLIETKGSFVDNKKTSATTVVEEPAPDSEAPVAASGGGAETPFLKPETASGAEAANSEESGDAAEQAGLDSLAEAMIRVADKVE